jgi:hypothetical protein
MGTSTLMRDTGMLSELTWSPTWMTLIVG